MDRHIRKFAYSLPSRELGEKTDAILCLCDNVGREAGIGK